MGEPGHGDASAVLHTPLYIIAMEESTKDALRVAEMLETLVRMHGAAAVGAHAHITPGMDVAAGAYTRPLFGSM